MNLPTIRGSPMHPANANVVRTVSCFTQMPCPRPPYSDLRKQRCVLLLLAVGGCQLDWSEAPQPQSAPPQVEPDPPGPSAIDGGSDPDAGASDGGMGASDAADSADAGHDAQSPPTGTAVGCPDSLEVSLPSVVAANRCLPARITSDVSPDSPRPRLPLPRQLAWFADPNCQQPVEEAQLPSELFFRAALPAQRRREVLPLRFRVPTCEPQVEHELDVRMGAQSLRDVCALLDDGDLQCWAGDVRRPTRNHAWPLNSTRRGVHAGCALEGGSVVCYGDGACTPVEGTAEGVVVPGLDGGVRTLDGSCALTDAGAMCWGGNWTAKFTGPAELCTRSRWLPLPGVVAVGESYEHLCATDGTTLQCWGINGNGQLGAGHDDLINSYTHTEVTGQITDVECDPHGCCLKVDGALWCWFGTDSEEWAAITSSADPGRPGALVGMGSDVGVFAGARDGCAMRGESLYCWGGNVAGLAGLPNEAPLLRSPTPVPLPAGNVEDVVVSRGGRGERSNCALIDGLPYCWGSDILGRLGVSGDAVSSSVPVRAGFKLSKDARLLLGEMFTCRVDDSLDCWGQVWPLLETINAPIGERYISQPAPLRGLAGAVADAAPLRNGMAVVHGAEVYTWGSDEKYLGRGANVEMRKEPGTVVLPGPARALASGFSHACALVGGDEGGIYCWGDDSGGRLGDDTEHLRNNSLEPVAVVALSAPEALDASGQSTCAIDDGGVACWGRIASSSDRPLPVQGLEPGSAVKVDSLAVSPGEACAVTDAGTLYCWDTSLTAVAMASGMSRVSGALGTFCATDREGRLYCWGENGRGQLGTGDSEAREEPTLVAGLTVLDDSFETTGGDKAITCARVSQEGEVSCWGTNYDRQFARSPWFVLEPTVVLPWEE